MGEDDDQGTTTGTTTRARRLARYLSKYKWYSPVYEEVVQDENDELIPPPNLDSAWAHFEHIGLPRCFETPDESGSYHQAEPGESEKNTMLYPVWKTKETDMGDFGSAVGLYFSTLKLFAIMAFVAGLINIPAMIYLNSNDYSPDGRDNLGPLLKVSAICTATTWEPCPTCTESDWDRFPSGAKDRFAVGEASDGSALNFIKVNNCEMNSTFWWSTYISMAFVILSIYLVSYLQKKRAVELDEAVQTTTDYSIKITNPPPTAKDTVLWQKFFEDNFEANVEVCTIALDNEALIKALVERRRLLIGLENMLPLGIKLNADDLAKDLDKCSPVSLWKKVLCCAKTPQRIVLDIEAKEEEILQISMNQNFKVANVFVTFDTEHSQRNVLKDLCVHRNKISDKKKYEGKILKIVEPDEPLSIRWTDLSDTSFYQIKHRIFTGLISVCIIVAGAFLIAWSTRVGPTFVSIIVILQSFITPMIVLYITSFESHYDESSMAASQYLKITAFRWVITVITPLVIVAFPHILDEDDVNGVIKNIHSLFIVMIIQRPIMQLLGIFGILYRHVFGPRAVDQRRMNLWFSGDSYTIGECYTKISEILFLTVFYCMLYPVAFFFASGIFSIYYWVDKFCILRSWKQGPKIGAAMSKFSMFFFKLCGLAYAIMAAYMGSQIPYDNACQSDGEDISRYTAGLLSVTLPLLEEDDGNALQETNVTAQSGYKYCDQETLRGGYFPAVGGVWMDGTQDTFSHIFGWSAVAVLTVVLVSFAYMIYKALIHPLFFASYEPKAVAKDKAFKDVIEIAAYVPQVRVPGFSFPFLICDDAYINPDHVGWNDPNEKGYNRHNLIKDVRSIVERRKDEVNIEDIDFGALFSIVRTYMNDGSVHSDSSADLAAVS